MSSVCIHVISHVCLVIWHGENCNERHYSNCSAKFLYTFHACLRAPVTSTSLDNFQGPWPWRGSQGQQKFRPLGFIFWQTFQIIRLKFDVVVKQSELNILIVLLNKIYFLIKGHNCSFGGGIKNLQHLQAFKHIFCKQILFKISGRMIDTIELYSLIQVKVTLMFIQGLMCARREKLLCQSSHKVPVEFGLLVVVICVSDEPHFYFISSKLYSRKRNQLIWCLETDFMLACIQTFAERFLSFCMMIDTNALYSLISVWMIQTFIQDYS